jgi:P-type Cu+ transporter
MCTPVESDEEIFFPDVRDIESDMASNCPKCGMSLERDPSYRARAKTIYACPMPDLWDEIGAEEHCRACGGQDLLEAFAKKKIMIPLAP